MSLATSMPETPEDRDKAMKIELLDRFATAALQGRIAATSPSQPYYAEPFLVRYAYDIAEMALVERDNRLKKLGLK